MIKKLTRMSYHTINENNETHTNNKAAFVASVFIMLFTYIQFNLSESKSSSNERIMHINIVPYTFRSWSRRIIFRLTHSWCVPKCTFKYKKGWRLSFLCIVVCRYGMVNEFVKEKWREKKQHITESITASKFIDSLRVEERKRKRKK